MAAKVIRYFFIINIFWTVESALYNGTYTGVADVAQGETQEAVYRTLFAKACEQNGAPPERTGVRHYYLARNEL